VQHFLERFNQRNKRNVNISEAAVRVVGSMSWPGNVRELENLIERLAIFAATDEISAEEVECERSRRKARQRWRQKSRQHHCRESCRTWSARKFSVFCGNRAQQVSCGAKLGIERKTLYEKARRLAIDLQSKKHE